MARKPERNLIVGLDIGTSKIMAIIGEVNPEGEVEVIGVGTHPSTGLKRGVVVNVESTMDSIQRAVTAAEVMAECQVHSAFTGIAGSHINSMNSHGIVAIRSREVSQSDVDRVIESARAVALPADQQILHILPQEFIIDGQAGIREPLGMSGVRLEAKVHLVTGAVGAAQNIVKCVRQCGVEVSDIILEQLASSYAVLADDEKELGVCLVDIGGGTTDIAIFTEGAISYTSVIPIAGDQVTNDIAVALRVPAQQAEFIKVQHACTIVQSNSNKDMINVPGVGNRPSRSVPQRTLAEVVQARYEEIFELVQHEIDRSGLADKINAGVVLTGGASSMKGAVELAESVLQKSVRLGVPKRIVGKTELVNSPKCATGIGLIQYGYEQQQDETVSMVPTDRVKSVWGRMRSWFQGNF